jgi:hypothetical protein
MFAPAETVLENTQKVNEALLLMIILKPCSAATPGHEITCLMGRC